MSTDWHSHIREISICSFRISCICFRFCLLFTNVLFCLVFQCTLPITHDVFDVFIGIFYNKTHSILVHCLFLNLSIEVYSGKKINKILSQVRWKSLRFGCGFSSFVSSNERVLFVSRNWILFVCYVFVPVLFFLRWTSTLIILNWTDFQWNQMQTCTNVQSSIPHTIRHLSCRIWFHYGHTVRWLCRANNFPVVSVHMKNSSNHFLSSSNFWF